MIDSMKASSFSEIRALLLQVRNTPDIELQEQECFLERTGLSPDQLRSINVALAPLPQNVLDGYHVLFIGGAGEYSAVNDYDWMPGVLELVRTAEQLSFPVFGSCWGHQVIARALGGVVINDLSQAELGCLPVILTEAGRADSLFASFPDRFDANMGHHDRVLELPPNAVELAEGRTQPNEAFRIVDKPIYGTQFHSELDAAREKERLIRYRPFYMEEMPDEEQFNRIVDSLQDTTEVDDLMSHFLEIFVVSDQRN